MAHTPTRHPLVFEVRGERDDGKICGFGAMTSRTASEALLESAEQRDSEFTWKRWWIEEVDPDAVWVVPSTPTPRQRYRAHATTIEPGGFARTHVEIWCENTVVAEYDRNYAMLDTFEPFRQGDRDFALISNDYTTTAVLDLQTGVVIAAEEPDPRGFCPVGFYVPDWWDIHNGNGRFPGTLNWFPADDEWPTGDFGFVWGCEWGDDASWKVQYLDLSGIQQGVVSRDDRFGVVHLDTSRRPGRDQIKCSTYLGQRKVIFETASYHQLDTGETLDPSEW